MFDFPLEEVEDCSNASFFTPVILPSLNAASNSSLEEAEDSSDAPFSAPPAPSRKYCIDDANRRRIPYAVAMATDTK